MAVKKTKMATGVPYEGTRDLRIRALEAAIRVSPAESRDDTVNRAAAYLAFLTGEAPKPAAPEDINT